MRNRAKCKLCNDIIESFTIQDYVECKCGEINIWGGNQKVGCAAHDWKNFSRVDDEGNEIVVKIIERSENKSTSTKSDMLYMLDELIKIYENLPMQAQNSYVTNQEMGSILQVLSAILRSS